MAGYSPWGCKESDMTELTVHTQRVEVRLNGGQNFLLFSQFGPCSLPIGRAVFCRAHISPSQPHKNRGCLITEFWKNRGPAEAKTDMLLASEGIQARQEKKALTSRGRGHNVLPWKRTEIIL